MSADEVGVKKHRLYSSKADKIISKLERKCWINHEICKELSKRNAVLKKSQENHQQIIDKLVSTISQFGDKYNNLKSENLFNAGGVELQELDQLVSDLVETSRSEWKKERETNEKQVMRNKRQSIIMSAPGTSLLRKSITLEPEASEINALSKLRQISDEPQQPAGKFIPLFEHFLVVGAPIEEANDVASFYQTLESQTISSRLKKTIDGIFSSPVFVGNLLQGNNSTTPSSAADVNKPNQTSSYFGFSRNRGKSLDQTASMLSSTQTVSADTELETETVGDDSNSTTVNVKSIFASPSLFLLKSRSGRESDRRVSENHEAGRANSIEQQEFENFVDFVHKQDENFPQSPAFSVNKDDHVKWDHVENGSNRCEGENEEVELKLSPKNEAKETSLAKIADNTNRSLQNFTSGFMAGSNAIKSNAGTAWSKFGGAFLSKLNPVSSSAQSPNAKSLPQPPQQPSTSTTNNEPSISGDSDLLTSYPMSTTAVPLAPTNPTEVEPEGFANKTELKETSILSKDLKTGNFIIPSSVLLRYPDNIDPPPVEVCDFCMPTGAKLHYLSSKDEDSSIQDILFGNTHSKRSGRSFVFLLEDKTVDSIAPDKSEDDKMGRLYGICVLHPRLLRTNVVDQAKKNPHKKNGKHSTADSSMSGTESVDQVNGSAGNHSSNLGVEKNVEFESLVCYAFITRFPFFDFFFQILYDIIALEKLKRIELTNDLLDTNFESSKDFYEYLPSKLLLSVLDKLSKINPETMRSNPSHKLILDEGLKPIDLCSLSPATDFTRMSDEESLHYLSDWCLTTLLSWVPPDLLVWCLSLLLQECKIIIIGHEAGLISSVVLGILTLLKPFRWVSPVIPMLPTKLLEFTEAPVPILAGVLVDPLESSKLSPQIILKRCSDMMEGVTTAVLDLSRVELNICTGTGDTFSNISLPNAFELSSSIEEKLKSSENVWNDFSSKNNVSTQQLSGPGTTTSENIVYGRSAFRPIYHPTYGHKTDVAQIQQLVQSHLHQLSEVAKDVFLKSKSDQQKLEEQLTRLSFSSQLSNIANQEADFYFSDSDSDRNHSDSSSGTDSDNEEAVRSFTPSKGAGKSLSGELRSFYEKIVQAEGSSMLKAEDAINEQTKVEEKARVLRKQLAPHSLHRLTVANIPTYNNQREFMQRFMKTQLFQDYLHENKVDG